MQCAALTFAARCKHGCSALHLKSGGSVDGRDIEPVPFSHRIPFLLSSLSIPSPILFHSFSHPFLTIFHSFSHPFPFLLSSFSVSSLIAFHSFSHPFPFLLPSLSVSSLILFRFFSHCIPLASVLCFHLHRIAWQSPARRGAGQGFVGWVAPSAHFALWDGLVSCVGRGA